MAIWNNCTLIQIHNSSNSGNFSTRREMLLIYQGSKVSVLNFSITYLRLVQEALTDDGALTDGGTFLRNPVDA
jgi:hypothetical protein